jgi:hypothetical protein
MKLAMTSMAVTASICASASEAAFLVASFMQFPLDLGMIHRRAGARTTSGILLGTPHDEYSLDRVPTHANIDDLSVEQQCGGILARVQPVYAQPVEF